MSNTENLLKIYYVELQIPVGPTKEQYGAFELVEFHHLSQEFYRLDQPARESLYHGASSPGLPLPTATRDDRVEEIFFQDRYALLPPHIVAREVVPQLSPSCASLETKGDFAKRSRCKIAPSSAPESAPILFL